jgi:hypothetical protein
MGFKFLGAIWAFIIVKNWAAQAPTLNRGFVANMKKIRFTST